MVGCGGSKQVSQMELQTRDVEVTQALNDYLYRNFGGYGDPKFATSWYSNIVKVEVNHSSRHPTATLVTNIYPDEEGKKFAQTIAFAVSGFNDPPMETIIIKNEQGRILAHVYR